jgi:hypothetical protein
MSGLQGTLLVSETGVTTLADIPAASLDGKFIRVCIAGIAGANTVHLKVNGNTILTLSSTTGQDFFDEVVFTWNSTNQKIAPQVWIGGTPSNVTSFNPANFTFLAPMLHIQ